MSTPKGKKSSSVLFLCEKCNSNISQKDLDQHNTDCPPSLEKLSYNFVKNGVLYSSLETKVNEDIKGISPCDLNNLVFVSQMGMQLCDLAIGEYTAVSDLKEKYPPCARMSWPTAEKSVIAVSLTKDGIDSSFGEKDIDVCISRISTPVYEARQITVVALSNIKTIELHQDLLSRIHKTYLNRLLTVGNRILIRFYGRVLKFEVKSMDPSETISDESNQSMANLSFTEGSTTTVDLAGDFSNMSIHDSARFCRVVAKTKFNVLGDENDYSKVPDKETLLLKIGGLDEEIEEIQNIINSALGKSKIITKSTITRGVLLYGSSGTGKTLVAKALAASCDANVVNISMTELYSKFEGNVEESITNLFADAIKFAPSMIIIDEIDQFCPSRTSRLTDTDKKIMSSFSSTFDYIHETADCKIFVLATSNKPDSIDPSFRRCGRLDREIEIPTPNPKGRLDILKKLLEDVPMELEVDDLKEVTNAAHGFVGSDLVSLCSRAALHATKSGSSKISLRDLKFALTRVRPSAMREVQIEVPDVKWADIGGQANLKLILRQAVEWPLKHPESFVRMGITPPRGVLMFGPPGCSKTMIAKALATESGLNFLSIKGPELFSKWVGESERAVREVFRKARQVAPSVIFFDEIDALGGERSSGSSTSVQERVLAQLLTELDGVTPLGDVTVLAATNRPDRIDKALLRPGRLDRIVYVPLPDPHTRREIFKLKLSKMPICNVDVEQLVNATEGYSGAEVNAVCHEAAMKALEENLNAENVNMEHFKQALNMITPRTPPSLLKIYEDYVKQ